MKSKTVIEHEGEITKKHFDALGSLNALTNIGLARLLISKFGIKTGIKRDERINGYDSVYMKRSWFGLGKFKERLRDRFSLHLEFDGERFRLSKVEDDLTDYYFSDYAMFAP